MTKEEFIDYYTSNGGLQKYKTKDGYYVPERTPRVAVPCNCGEEICKGWVMVADVPEIIEEYAKMHGQPTPT